jgi:membrane protein YdbS with pleckstrin-like domain
METRFSSKIDGWMIPIMIVSVGALITALVAVLVEETPWPLRALTVVVVILVTLLLFTIFKSTYYVIAGDTLRIVSGPFKWKIPVADIVGVTPSRNPLSSPALSMDRLKISYGKRKFVLVSPEDKAGFIRAIERAQQESQ